MTPKDPKPKPDDKSDEYRRFEDFARKLVAVPKHEIDAERAKEAAEKAKS